MTRRRKRGLLLLAATVVVAGLGVYLWTSRAASTETTSIPVSSNTVMKVGKGSLNKTVSATGYAQPVREKNLFFQSSGTVEEVRVSEGDRVKANEVLVVLDKRQAQLDYLLAESEYRRVKINGSQSDVEAARLSMEIARDNLEGRELKAPFEGLVVDVSVEVGDSVSANQVVVTVIDDSSYEVEVQIDESEIRYVKTGQTVQVQMEALPGEEITGRVVGIGETASNDSGVVSVPVTVALEEGNHSIRSGYSADLEIQVGEASGQVVIPIAALMNRDGKEFVIKVADGKTTQVPVQTGMTDGLRVVVESGLNAGDEIVINAGPSAVASESSSRSGRGQDELRPPAGMDMGMPGGPGVEGRRF